MRTFPVGLGSPMYLGSDRVAPRAAEVAACPQAPVDVLDRPATPPPADPSTPEGTPVPPPPAPPPKPDPPAFRGVVYTRYPSGSLDFVAWSGETSPDVGPDGQSIIPADAVVDNRVMMYVDGIRQSLPQQIGTVRDLLQAPELPDDYGVSVRQAVVGVHQGVGAHVFSDIKRIVGDFSLLKALQASFLGVERCAATAAKLDPSVKAVHDLVRQSLQVGRDVTIGAFSGGGTQVALALTLLSREEGGRYRQQVSDHVRILALTPGASSRDFEKAGVKPENIEYVAGKDDPVYQLFRTYVGPDAGLGNIVGLARGTVALARMIAHPANVQHDAYYLFEHSRQPDGQEPIQAFMDGGAGHEHIVS